MRDHVHHLPIILDGAPDPHTFTSNRRDCLIEMPVQRGRLFATAKVVSDLGTKHHSLGADGFATQICVTISKHLFNIMETQREAKIETHRALNDSWRRQANEALTTPI